jgi:hypothetical protein
VAPGTPLGAASGSRADERKGTTMTGSHDVRQFRDRLERARTAIEQASTSLSPPIPVDWPPRRREVMMVAYSSRSGAEGQIRSHVTVNGYWVVSLEEDAAPRRTEVSSHAAMQGNPFSDRQEMVDAFLGAMLSDDLDASAWAQVRALYVSFRREPFRAVLEQHNPGFLAWLSDVH